MDLEKTIKDLGKNIGKWVCDKKESDVSININRFDEVEIFKIIFFKLVHENKFNEAENLLFKEIEVNNNKEVYEIGFKFYDNLESLDSEILNKNNFKKQDILQGEIDLKRKYDINLERL